MIRLLLIFTWLLSASFAYAQERYTINGYIKDATNGEALIGATLYLKTQNTGTTTNVYGYYSLTLPTGVYEVDFSYLGYARQSQTIELSKNIRLDINLKPEGEELEEVVVRADKDQSIVQSVEMSVNSLDIKTISKIPAFLGEVDVIKSLQQLPGVATVGEGASGFNVRGGNVGQNLILLDEATVYNSSHLLGFFSVFNPDAVKDTKLYKGAVPAQFGGRIASLLDVRMKDGNNQDHEVTGGIGTIFSRLAFEGPLLNKKGSFIVAGRRSYIDVLARPFVEVLKDGGALNFYDLTGKANYNINDRNRIYLSGYLGRDVFFFDKNQGFSWGNNTATLRWNKIFNDRLFANFSAIYSNYDYALRFGENARDNFKWNSSISNFTFKPAFSYFVNSNNEISFGVEGNYYNFDPANAQGTSNGETVDISLARKYNLESALYVGNDQKINDVFSVQYGLRYSLFHSFGKGIQYVYGEATEPGKRRLPMSEKQFASGKLMAKYDTWEPRFSAKAQLNNQSSIKVSYNRMAQYLHLISNTTASNPLDVWTPSSNNIAPQLGDQYTVGYFRTIGEAEKYEFSVEGYYRNTQNQVDYIDGADLLINPFLEGDLLSGDGRAYGLEFYLQKKTGRFNGWIAYTLGKTELKVRGINNDDWYATRFDQRHNLKLTGFYDINKRWSASANFTLISGTPTTFPTSRFIQQGILIPYNANDSRNNVRLSAYHRFDVSFRLEGRTIKRNGKDRKNSDYWVFGVYNLYSRKNQFSINFSQDDKRYVEGDVINSAASQLAIVGVPIPSISYNFKF
jgi:CarboxypepD_reg-like domain/TonB-dependent Receptor Plug Domain